MPLTNGSRLGHYEIVSPLGAGGMGEVYRARDTRLGRAVAIKLLRPEIAQDAESRRRFEREARAVSGLNHPHICALYDIGREGGVEFIVLEHLEGETLSHRLRGGALPLNDVLRHATEIVAALDGAHRCGVVHRDVKPGNIMLTKHGVKLLDFGLARLKPALPPPANGGVATSPATAEPTRTVETSVLGTIPYMSPEQIEGREVDARSDIFSAGIVIYEMITGRRPFEGDSPAAVMAAILKSEPPPMSGSLAPVPRVIESLVRHCLAKNRDERWQSAHDVGMHLRSIQESAAMDSPIAESARAPRGARVGWVVAAAGLAALVAALLLARTPPAASPQAPVRFSIDAPGGAALDEPYWSQPSVSPDGRTVVFAAISEEKFGLWIRPLDALSARLLPGTEGALSPFWSPDGRFIAFFADGRLKSVALAGGAPQSICDVPSPAATGTWGSAGTILFQVDEAPGQEGLYRVPAAGGRPSRVPLRDASGKALTATQFPYFLPDGRFLVSGATAEGGWGSYLASLESGTCELIPWKRRVVSRLEYAPPGYLLGVSENTLYAQRFDVKTARLEGNPVAIAEDVGAFGGGARFSVSTNGVLVHGPFASLQSRLTWFDRAGRTLGSIGAPATQEAVALSPDDRRLAVSILDARGSSSQIHVFSLPDGIPTRMTSDLEALEFFPVWSPDGREIAYSSPRGAPPNLFRKRFDGRDAELLVAPNGHAQLACDWSPDGHTILYADRDPNTGTDLWALDLQGDREPRPWLRTSFAESRAQFSPDGNGVAYVSTESGRLEVYLRPFRETGERRRVSGAGGQNPRWRGDGREIFYLDLETEPTLYAASVDPATLEVVGAPRPLFRMNARVVDYDVTRDGQRFIVILEDRAGAGPVAHVLVNWTAGIR